MTYFSVENKPSYLYAFFHRASYWNFIIFSIYMLMIPLINIMIRNVTYMGESLKTLDDWMFSYIYNIIKRIKNAREYPLLLVELKVYICLPTAGVVQVRLDPLLPSTYYIDSTKGILCFKGMFSMSRLGSSAQLHSTLRYFKLGSTHTHTY